MRSKILSPWYRLEKTHACAILFLHSSMPWTLYFCKTHADYANLQKPKYEKADNKIKLGMRWSLICSVQLCILLGCEMHDLHANGGLPTLNLPQRVKRPNGLSTHLDLMQSTCAPIGLWWWFGALSSKLLCSGWIADASIVCAVECSVRHAINIGKSNLIKYWGCDQYLDALYSYCLNDLSRIYATQTISPRCSWPSLLFFSFEFV